jgi:Zn-finger nucleic acid-binding protein
MSDASVRCPACGGAFTSEANVCTFCQGGVRFAGMGHTIQKQALRCPRCPEGPPLFEIGYRGVQIDVCGACEGSWYDAGELETLVRAAREDAKQGTFEATRPPSSAAAARSATEDVLNPQYIRCPHCDMVMNRQNWEQRSGVVVDWCLTHGIWLDGGELQRMRGWAARTPEGPTARSPAATGRTLPEMDRTPGPAVAFGTGSHTVGEVLLEVLGDAVTSVWSFLKH